MSATIKKKVFFPNLNGVRFVAAMMVVVHHVEQIKINFGYPSVYRDNIYGTNLGGLGVTLFFVLSGFLITFLLLEEKKEFGSISLKDFYIRRILRIWPLYYLVVFLSFFIIPTFFSNIIISDFKTMLNVDYYKKLAMYMFFTPNIAFITMYPVLFVSQAWSVGVEEQFYAIWPLLVKQFRRPLHIMISIIVVYICINMTLENLVWKTGGMMSQFFVYKNFFLVTRIDCMAVGGMFAFLALNKNRLFIVFQSKIFQLLVYATTIILAYYEIPFKGLGHLPYAILFGVIIFNLALNHDTILKLNHSVFEYGGKISYGIYMFHSLGIILIFLAYKKIDIHLNVIGTNFALYGASIILTLLLSSLSYQFYEKYFLLKKNKFSSIISGDNVQEQSDISKSGISIKSQSLT